MYLHGHQIVNRLHSLVIQGNKKLSYFSGGKIYSLAMRSRLYAIISIPLFGILYCYTTVGVFIVLILTLLHLKRPVRFLFQMWAKSLLLAGDLQVDSTLRLRLLQMTDYSALTSVCQEMANNLNIDDIICSELEVYNGKMTGRPVGHLCFGEEKAVRLKEYCEKHNSSRSEAWYYGDSISDLPALNAVGNAVCINPDKKLKKTALKRDWKILYWKT